MYFNQTSINQNQIIVFRFRLNENKLYQNNKENPSYEIDIRNINDTHLSCRFVKIETVYKKRIIFLEKCNMNVSHAAQCQ